MIDFRPLRIERRFAGVRRIGVSKNHGTIRRLDIGATHAKPPRGLTARFVTKLRIPSRGYRNDGSTPKATSLRDLGDGNLSRPGIERRVALRGQRHVASAGKSDGYARWVVWRR